MINQPVEKDFVYLGLMKYFTMNINFSLILPVVVMIIYGVTLILKFRKRNQYFIDLSQ